MNLSDFRDALVYEPTEEEKTAFTISSMYDKMKAHKQKKSMDQYADVVNAVKIKNDPDWLQKIFKILKPQITSAGFKRDVNYRLFKDYLSKYLGHLTGAAIGA